MNELSTEIRKRLDDYFVAFSSQSASRVIAFYKPDSFITVHQLGADRSGKGGAGKDVTAWVGALYAFEKTSTDWVITEVWLFDEPPASLDLTGFA